MRYGIALTNFGAYGEPRAVTRVAQAAEAAGWDGLFIWDHLAFVWGPPSADPWITLAAAATVTTRLALGLGVAALPRYQPHLLAHAITTLDHLSSGRVILGAGLGGVPEEFTAFGGPGDTKVRAAMLDEGLDVLARLWTGETVTHHGDHYTVDGVTLAPLPVQRPRPPVWIGGESRAALRRAARWDGWISGCGPTEMTMTPQGVAETLAAIRQQRSAAAPFEFAVNGYSERDDRARVGEFASAGATWWLEGLHDMRGDLDAMLARVGEGPPH